MRVLVACEFSGTVRRAFRAKGHDAWSCDILEAEDHSEHHHHGDVIGILDAGWVEFVRQLMQAPIDRIAIENPVSIISTRLRPADQMIHPWEHGHGETKATCLWLKNLPLLQPTQIVEGRENRVWRMPPGPDRWRERSRTFPGIAAAMADQWGIDHGVQGELFGAVS